MKICTKCKQEKPYNEFYKNRLRKDGYNAWCKDCLRPEIKRNKQKEEYRQKQAEYSSRDEIRERNNLNKRLRRISQPEKYREIDRIERTKIDPLKKKAHHKIKLMVNYHNFPKAKNFICSICHKKQAQHYHHYLGYEKEHWLDVIPVCTFCHKRIENATP